MSHSQFIIYNSLGQMSHNFKKERANQCRKEGINGSYYFIDMCTSYPFGQLRQMQGQGTQVLVRKKLFVSSKEQQEILLRTAKVLQSVNHPFLINLHHFDQQDKAIYFYYQYAHLTIQKWILDLGDQIIDTLKNQMLALATFLSHHKICFTFSPQLLGLSKQIEVQYFLHEFSVLEEKSEVLLLKNFRLNQERIEQFFEGFRQDYRKSKMGGVFSSQFVESDQGKESMLSSITTRESWSPSSPKAQLPLAPRPAKSKLTEKLERSKCKTNEILEKLRNIKNLQF